MDNQSQSTSCEQIYFKLSRFHDFIQNQTHIVAHHFADEILRELDKYTTIRHYLGACGDRLVLKVIDRVTQDVYEHERLYLCDKYPARGKEYGCNTRKEYVPTDATGKALGYDGPPGPPHRPNPHGLRRGWHRRLHRFPCYPGPC